MSTTSESSEVLPLFPTFVWKSQLGEAVFRPIDEQLETVLGELCREELARGQSWQSRHDLHVRSELAGLMHCVNQATRAVLQFLKIREQPFEVTGCWLNVSAPGAAHALHNHPNNYLSGVYYMQVQAGADTINFHDPRAQTGVIRPPVIELVAANADQAVVSVREGALLLFPAWLPHSVDANASDRRRISASFNIMFTAYTETMSRPMWDPGIR
ncbi:MAG: 2OG-Fe(II) oxygenase family protein [Gammaproteobacteria bacterium]